MRVLAAVTPRRFAAHAAIAVTVATVRPPPVLRSPAAAPPAAHSREARQVAVERADAPAAGPDRRRRPGARSTRSSRTARSTRRRPTRSSSRSWPVRSIRARSSAPASSTPRRWRRSQAASTRSSAPRGADEPRRATVARTDARPGSCGCQRAGSPRARARAARSPTSRRPPRPLGGRARGQRASAARAPADAILDVLRREPLVAICERHMLQEWHDLIQAVLTRPGPQPATRRHRRRVRKRHLPSNSATASSSTVAAVPRADLVQMWRQIGDPTWNAPVYEQFYRTVRAVNRTPARRPAHPHPARPGADHDERRRHPPDDRAKAHALAAPMDAHFATVVERDVLSRGRRALLIAGKGHLLRDLSTDRNGKHPERDHPDRPRHPRQAVRDRQPDPPGRAPSRSQPSPARCRELAHTQRVVAPLRRNLARSHRHHRRRRLDQRARRPRPRPGRQPDTTGKPTPSSTSGPGAQLTASQPDPAIYHWGSYPHELQRAAALAGRRRPTRARHPLGNKPPRLLQPLPVTKLGHAGRPHRSGSTRAFPMWPFLTLCRARQVWAVPSGPVSAHALPRARYCKREGDVEFAGRHRGGRGR